MNKLLKINKNRSKAGFTLVELVVAMSISVLLLGSVAFIINSSSDSYKKVSERIGSHEEIRTAFNTLASDLASIYLRNEEDPKTDKLVVLQGMMLQDGGGGRWQSDSIGFFLTKPRRVQEPNLSVGDLCFVQYFTQVTKDNNVLDSSGQPIQAVGTYSRKLYRQYLSSTEVFKMLEAGDSFTTLRNDPDKAEAIAYNVIQFTVEPLIAQEGGSPRDWKEGSEDHPTHAKISVRIANKKAASAMRSESDWNPSSTLFQGLIASSEDLANESENLKTYSTELPVKLYYVEK